MKNGDVCTTDWKLPDGRDKRKCPVHNAWMKKGECPLCYVAKQAQIKEYERTGGSNKPPVKIGTSDSIGKQNEN